MRKEFVNELHTQMKTNSDIWLVTMDLGYGLFDDIKRDYPDRYINTGASEQAGMDIACGLAMSGKIPFTYSITPFLILRPFETLRTYINHEKLNVKLIGSGRDKMYSHDGVSHDATDIPLILSTLPNIKQHYPETTEDAVTLIIEMINRNEPEFVSLIR